MIQERKPHIALSSAEAESVVHYRVLNRLAVASLLLGILSVAAFANKLMWCVPIVGVALAIIALWTISRNQSAMIGRGAALAGLSLSLVFLASATTNHLVRQRTLFRQAKPHASKWIEMVQEGRLREAHQLHLSQFDRQKLGTNLHNYYEASREADEEMEGFFNQLPISKIVELGQQGQLRFEADEEIGREDLVVQRYAIDYQVDDQPQTLPFLISIAREYNSEHGEARWRVVDVTDPDSADR